MKVALLALIMAASAAAFVPVRRTKFSSRTKFVQMSCSDYLASTQKAVDVSAAAAEVKAMKAKDFAHNPKQFKRDPKLFKRAKTMALPAAPNDVVTTAAASVLAVLAVVFVLMH